MLQMGNLISTGLEVSHRLSTDTYRVFLPLHRKFAEAIAARDPAAASSAMAELLAETHAFLDKQLRRPRRRANGDRRRALVTS
jgi:DNA-binding FadR family transcriptional regulator